MGGLWLAIETLPLAGNCADSSTYAGGNWGIALCECGCATGLERHSVIEQ